MELKVSSKLMEGKMKKLLLVLFVMFLLVGAAFAEEKGDVLLIPKTTVLPEIDAIMDNVYKNVAEVRVYKSDPGAQEPDDWFDSFASARMLWDDDNLYIFLHVYDDIINTGTDWNYDGVELYFDGDNSKTEGGYDGFDDLQMRFNVGETELDEIDIGYGTGSSWDFVVDGISYVIEETDMGWDMECSIPLEDLQLDPDSEFGFDIQLNDADESTRETMLRWWQDADNANDQWKDASLFGTAMLRVDREVSEVLDIPKTETAPTVDGVKGDDEWDASSQISGEVPDSNYDIYNTWDWSEMRFRMNIMYDDANIYFFMKTWDDIINTGPQWDYDGVELYFDGDNSKGEEYDGLDDIQLRFNVGETELEEIDVGYGTSAGWGFSTDGIEYIIDETEDGWDLEVSIPLEDLMLDADSEFGFDIQLNDADDELRGDKMLRWWSDNNDEWKNASLFGTAILKVGATGVADKAPATINSFELTQNYPNPFNPTTNITYSVARQGQVQLTVYDILGNEVATLVNEVKPAGQYTATFDGADLSSGVYLYTLTSAGQTVTHKMMLIK